jgi:phage gp29-like protein
MGSSHYLAHNDIPMVTDGDNISIRSTKEMNKYKSLHHREFAHIRVYDVNLLERVDLDEELPTVLWIIGWGKHYDEPRLASQEHLALMGELAWRQHNRP